MSTVISGVMLRDLAPDTFADITETPFTYSRANGETALEFDADLTDDEQLAIWSRMTTRNDDELADRATATTALTAACAADADLAAVQAAVCALAKLMGIGI